VKTGTEYVKEAHEFRRLTPEAARRLAQLIDQAVDDARQENQALRAALERLASLSFPDGMPNRFKEAVNQIAQEALAHPRGGGEGEI
jgi:hypothetical protein